MRHVKLVIIAVLAALWYPPAAASVHFRKTGISLHLPQVTANNKPLDMTLKGLNVCTGLLRGIISTYEGQARCTPKKPAHELRACGALVRVFDALLFILTHPDADHTQDLGWLVFDLVDATQFFTNCDAGTLLRKLLPIESTDKPKGSIDQDEMAVTSERDFTSTIEALIGAATPFMTDTTETKRRILFTLRGMLSLSRHLFQKRDMTSNVLIGTNLLYIAGKGWLGSFPTTMPPEPVPPLPPEIPTLPAPAPAARPPVQLSAEQQTLFDRLKYQPHGTANGIQITYDTRNPATECCVCFEDFTDASRVVIYPCGHFNCAGCADQWRDTQGHDIYPHTNRFHCPSCKAPAYKYEVDTFYLDVADLKHNPAPAVAAKN